MVAVSLMSAAHSQAPDPQAAQTEAQRPQMTAPAEVDIKQATNHVKDAWNDFTHCRRSSACNAYFESFGVAIPFGDGSIAPFAHAQRLTATSRDCIKTAKAYLEQGNRSLAVQWVMAARIENKRVRDWLGSHPDAVLEALRHCCW
jgi:hypothetical protein